MFSFVGRLCYIILNMQEPRSQLPFRTLGNHLKILRKSQQKSLDEVSGAIEIDTDLLKRIEKGEERPSEDLLMLLINYFDIQDHEAVQLWTSAGYFKNNEGRRHHPEDPQSKVATILLALDVRVLYSDEVVITGNEHGIIMSFLQNIGQDQPLPISRVGMSYSEAEEVLRVLERAILRHKYLPKLLLLPPGD